MPNQITPWVRHDLIRPLIAASVFGLLLILATLTGITRSPLQLLIDAYQNHYIGFIAGQSGLFILILFLFYRPSLKAWAWLIAAGTLFTLLYLWISPDSSQLRTKYRHFLPGIGFGAAALLALLYRARRATPQGMLSRYLLAASLLITTISLFVQPYLVLTAAFHPSTFDQILLHIDRSFGFQPSTTMSLLAGEWPTFRTVLLAAYTALPFGLALIFGAQLSRGAPPKINACAAWLICTLGAILLYHIVPAAGPVYLLGHLFPAHVPTLTTIPFEPIVLVPAHRNAMPSMHFGWALMMWLVARSMGMPWIRAVFALLTGLMLLATLALGEHYLIDLVVAVPFVTAIVAYCTRFAWSHRNKQRAVLLGLGLTFAWLGIIRFVPEILVNVPGLTWLLTILTIGASAWVYRALEKDVLAGDAAAALAVLSERPATERKREWWMAVGLFVVSGFSALVYEVVFAKSLALTFGSMATATYAVLATYMGGMAIGAWIGGKVAAGTRHPLILYAFCELSIAIYCLATPAIFVAIRGIYVQLAGDLPPDAGILIPLRISLGILALLTPTVLMGMTLPIMARFLSATSSSLGRSVAALYGANTLGAALGALVAGYFVIPTLGIGKTTMMAALANLLVALIAFRLFKYLSQKFDEPIRIPSIVQANKNVPDAAAVDRRLGYFAFVVLLIGGGVTLAIEIIYMHLLAVVAGNSTYAFSLMLFTFLLGLGLGAELARRALQRLQLASAIAYTEFALGFLLLATIFVWSGLPDYFASYASYPLARNFGSREVIRGIVCWIAMFPPAVLIGFLYPVTMECIGRAFPKNPIGALGTGAALNTLGNILGVLIGGFVLLEQFGPLRAVHLLAAICMLLGIAALVVAKSRVTTRAWLPVPIVLAMFAVQPSSFDYTALATGANVYFAPQGYGTAIDHAESIDGGLTSVSRVKLSDGTDQLTLLTNGKFQGNNSMAGEMKAQVGFALSPLLHTQARSQALVIGYGSGVSARTLHAAGFEQLDVVDLSADIIEMANKYFVNVNDRVTEKTGVTTYITDGRNFLLLQPRRYDVISMEISSIWFAGAASLYNREFYTLAKQRLNKDGVLQQWVQFHHITPLDVLRIVGSVRSEFRYVWLYLIGGQGMIIATNNPMAFASKNNVAKLDKTATLRGLLALYEGTAESLRGMMLLDPEGADLMLNSWGVNPKFLVSTDDNLFLEYSTPKGNVLNSSDSTEKNLRFIKHFSPVGRKSGSAKK